MKINKRECRKSKPPQWKADLNNGLFHADQIKYLIKSARKNIGGQRLLVLYFYKREEVKAGNYAPHYTLFQSKTEYVTLEHLQDGTSKWHTAKLENLAREAYFFRKCAFHTAKEEERVLRFCRNKQPKGLESLRCFQDMIEIERGKQRKRKRELQIVERMKPLAALPGDLKSWVNREILPHYVFYDYKKGSKNMSAYCTACGKELLVSDVKYNQKGLCPLCHKSVTFKSRGKRGRILDRDTVQVIQKVSEHELVIRIIKVYQVYLQSDLPEEDIFENSHIFLRWDEQKNMTVEPYYYCYGYFGLTSWKAGNRPVFSYWRENFEAGQAGYLYCQNLNEVFSHTPWQYSQLQAYYQSDGIPLFVARYLDKYLRYPMLEYLVKLRLYRLVTDIVYEMGKTEIEELLQVNGRNLMEVLKVEKRYLPLLQKADPGSGQLKMIQQYQENHIALDEILLRWCKDQHINRADIVIAPLKFMTLHRLMRYANEQFAISQKPTNKTGKRYYRMQDLLTEYRDYLSMGEELKFDLSNSFVLYPARLHAAHDKTSRLFREKQMEKYSILIEEMYEELNRKYHFEKSGFMVIPPHSSKEIVEEGHRLHNCVDSYIDRVAKRSCTILFVRSMKNASKPLCTVEIQDRRVVQARGYKNAAPAPKVKQFIEDWEKTVLCAPERMAA